jgi:hypothetical protein
MNKKIIVGIIVLIVLGIGYYLLSPYWNNNELDEASPLATSNSTGATIIKDDLETMTPEMKQKFEQETMAMKNKTMVMADAAPSGQARIVSQADFKPRAHDVSGKALLIEQNGQYTLRFENFETINGPDVDIYLSSDLGDTDFVNLGDLKATKGNVNYAVPAGTDVTKYNKVLVWCKAFSVLFSYAELK